MAVAEDTAMAGAGSLVADTAEAENMAADAAALATRTGGDADVMPHDVACPKALPAGGTPPAATMVEEAAVIPPAGNVTLLGFAADATPTVVGVAPVSVPPTDPVLPAPRQRLRRATGQPVVILCRRSHLCLFLKPAHHPLGMLASPYCLRTLPRT